MAHLTGFKQWGVRFAYSSTRSHDEKDNCDDYRGSDESVDVVLGVSCIDLLIVELHCSNQLLSEKVVRGGSNSHSIISQGGGTINDLTITDLKHQQ